MQIKSKLCSFETLEIFILIMHKFLWEMLEAMKSLIFNYTSKAYTRNSETFLIFDMSLHYNGQKTKNIFSFTSVLHFRLISTKHGEV